MCLAGVSAPRVPGGQDADTVVLVVEVLAALVVEGLYKSRGIKVILETAGGGLDGRIRGLSLM